MTDQIERRAEVEPGDIPSVATGSRSSRTARVFEALQPSPRWAGPSLALVTLIVMVPIIVMSSISPIHGAASLDFFTASTGVTTGVLIADVLAASAVVRVFAGHRLNVVDRLMLIVLAALPPVMLGLSLLDLLVSIANCVPEGARSVCRSPAADPNDVLAALAAGLCLLVAQYALALVARPKD